MSSQDQSGSMKRWRMVLGKFAEKDLPVPLSEREQRIEASLDFLYNREHKKRGYSTGPIDAKKGPGSLDPSQLNVPNWIAEVRELFPQDTVEIIEKHALEKYELKELITDKETLEKMEPSYDLLKMVLTFRGQMKGDVLEIARRLVRQVVEEIKAKMKAEISNLLSGKLNRFRKPLYFEK